MILVKLDTFVHLGEQPHVAPLIEDHLAMAVSPPSGKVPRANSHAHPISMPADVGDRSPQGNAGEQQSGR